MSQSSTEFSSPLPVRPSGAGAVPSNSPVRAAWRWVMTPLLAVLTGLDRVLATGRDLLWVFVGLAIGWWLYVPVHELLHALGCLATGGTVSKLEVARLYGGDLLAAVFPFVVAESEYAGRLSGFDTGGNDWIYLATVLAPYLLTVWPGIWALGQVARRRSAIGFGLVLPCAMAPLVSLPGDAYEIGSILVTWLPAWRSEPMRQLLRGDDVQLRVEALQAAGAGAPWIGFWAAVAVAVIWAFATLRLGSSVAALLEPKSPAAAAS